MKPRNTIATLLIAALLLGLAVVPPRAFAQVRLAASSAAVPVPAEFFGMHTNNARRMTALPALPFGTWRLWDAGVAWAKLQPQRDRWDFTLLDRHVAMAEERGIGILLTLGSTPEWASARPREKSPYGPGRAAEPAQMQDWRNYVRTVAQRYKGRIRAYEIWNEPNEHDFFTGTPENLVELAREAHGIVKGIDPGATVVSPSCTASGGLAWLDRYLSLGGAQYADVIGYHLYVYPKPPESAVRLLSKVQDVLARHGVAKPLWTTELGWAKPKVFPSPEHAPGYVARTHLLLWAAGSSRVYWYAWNNTNFVSIHLNDGERLSPAGVAYRTVESWMRGRVLHACSSSADVWTCELTAPGGEKSRVVWTLEHPAEFPVPDAWGALEYETLTGGREKLNGRKATIGPAPILFRTASAVATAR